MTVLAKGIAHISFPGGGTFLPARSPYDREMLIEHVAHRVRAKGRVQVLLNEQRWLVDVGTGGASGDGCSACGRTLDMTWCVADVGVPYCAKCAFASGFDSAPPGYRRLLQAS